MMIVTSQACRCIRSRWFKLLFFVLVSCQFFLVLETRSTVLAAIDARDTVQNGTVEFGFLTGYWQGNNFFGNEPSANRSAVFFLPQWGVVLTDEFKAWLFSGNLEF